MRPDPPQDPVEITLDYAIVETGDILGTESIEAPAGTFENCLKIEYRTKTEVVAFPPERELHPPANPLRRYRWYPTSELSNFIKKWKPSF